LNPGSAPVPIVFSGSQHMVSTYSSKNQAEITLSAKSSQEHAGLNIFEKYNLIKKKNELLTNSTYAQFWKKTSTAQHRLLSTFDTEKGRMHMVFLQAQVPHPKEISDYKRETFEFDVKEVHPADQMDMYRKTGEMIFTTLENTSMIATKLQVSLNNVQSQLKLENISSLAKENKIKSLEELVLKIGYDPSNVKAIEELLKKKNVDIASLRKQLKLSATEDSQEKEIAKSEGHKEEMLKLIMEQNAQIKEMEVELDKLVKEKELNVPMIVIPLNAVPLTRISTATTTTTTEIPSAILVTVPYAFEILVKSMEYMTLQTKEIKILQKDIENLQKVKSIFQSRYNTEMHKSQRLTQELQKLQKERVMAKTLSEAKENIWMDISKSMIEIWPLIQIVF
jgi:ParB-like chromosome segregation protein Spo0J